MSPNKEKSFLISLNHFPKFGEKRLKLLKKHFKNWEEAYRSKPKHLVEAGINEKIALEFSSFRNTLNIEYLLELMAKEAIRVIEIGDPEYPSLLKEIYDPPALLYCRGDLDAFGFDFIAVVGSRKCTPYGEQATKKISKDLVENGFGIASGLAMGIDSVAHQSALEAKGKTIAVLGSGIENQSIYPSLNRRLANDIASNKGLIISEFSPGTPPLKHHFPLRNRIISGLSKALVVVEAIEKSGALISASTALDQNREVFAVPGSIFSQSSKGTNSLIKQGAKLIDSSSDIIEALDLNFKGTYIVNDKIQAESPEEEILIPHLSRDPLHIDELKRLSGLDLPSLSSALSMLELRGLIKNFGGMKYAIK